MGKGDKRTRRGKIFAGSYGKTRKKPHTAAFVATEKPVAEKAPKKRTPKVVKSAPAPEPAVEETPAPAPVEETAPAAETASETPAADAPAPAEQPAADTPSEQTPAEETNAATE
jgi:ribosomal small subunit protein bTHX